MAPNLSTTTAEKQHDSQAEASHRASWLQRQPIIDTPSLGIEWPLDKAGHETDAGQRAIGDEATPRPSFQQTRVGRSRLRDAQESSGGRFMSMFAAASRSDSDTGRDRDHVPAHPKPAATADSTLLDTRLHFQINAGRLQRPRPIHLPKRRAYRPSLFSLARVDPSDWLSFAATADQPRPQTLSNRDKKPAVALIRSADFGCGTPFEVISSSLSLMQPSGFNAAIACVIVHELAASRIRI
ncbi:hypothetical protein MKX08_008985 [Trichoderma sp. CBMAI-0020]|nr:hypothetical protein MKX08_008985 [Trichoderma sp. CBMAI-0020]